VEAARVKQEQGFAKQQDRLAKEKAEWRLVGTSLLARPCPSSCSIIIPLSTITFLTLPLLAPMACTTVQRSSQPARGLQIEAREQSEEAGGRVDTIAVSLGQLNHGTSWEESTCLSDV